MPLGSLTSAGFSIRSCLSQSRSRGLGSNHSAIFNCVIFLGTKCTRFFCIPRAKSRRLFSNTRAGLVKAAHDYRDCEANSLGSASPSEEPSA